MIQRSTIDLATAPIDGIVAPAQQHLAYVRTVPHPLSLEASAPRAIYEQHPAGLSAIAQVGQYLPPQPPSGGGGPAVPTRQQILDPWTSIPLRTYA